ncbi:hypothetical protein [Beijerinckia mobilis]|uniref:hypothetical protein n=1 Tax=Beijerinckia mobilis TaxID=231434 RepID=UPI0005565D7C|nr:hypothetical protein [Beijerinckia mobilis]
MKAYHLPRPDTAFSLSPISFDTFDHEAARREGWDLVRDGVYSDGVPKVQLQSLRDNSPFSEDRDVWSHVVEKARLCSSLHRQALDLVDRLELMAIHTVHGFW